MVAELPTPSLSDDSTDRLLRALADATRRGLLDRLRDRPGLTLGELAAGVTVSRQALSKHLALLEAAELVVTLWRGREKLHYLNPRPLQALPTRWVTTTADEADGALQALQAALAPPSAAVLAAGPPAIDPVLAALQQPPLDGARIAEGKALAAARRFLAGTAEATRRLLGALAPETAYRQPESGGFSLAQHLWHLADLEALGWTPRFERLLAESCPRLAGVDGDRLAIEGRYQERPWRGAARRFIAQRRRTLGTLARYDTAALARPALFAGRQSSAGDVLAAMVAHDHEHLAEMAALWISIQRQGDPR
ncbi:MAG TPA: DinB family protein [Ideonella sp.]|nr:DinB family protein [Ideonella sp.]